MEKIKQNMEGCGMVKKITNEKLNMELMSLKTEEESDLKLRQYLWENSQELKELKRRVRAAYVGRVLAAQMAEKEAAVVNNKLELKKYRDCMESNIASLKQQELKVLQEAKAQQLRYKEELLNQMEQSSKKQDAYEEYLRDKAMLELSMNRLKEEVRREEEDRKERLKQFKQDIEQTRRLQEDYNKQRFQVYEEEDRRVQTYLDKQEKEMEDKVAKLKEKEKWNKENQEKLNKMLSINGSRKDEREEIFYYLEAERFREKEFQRERTEIENSLRWQEEIKKFINKQQQEKIKTIEEENHLQLAYRKQLEAELAKGESLSQIELQKKRLKALQYRKELQEQLEDKHKRLIEGWQREAALEKLRDAEENQRKRLIEEERIKMLKMHAPKLIGYLPTGILCEDDLSHLGPEFVEEFDIFKSINST